MPVEKKLLNFKASIEEIERWKENAHSERKTLSRWIRDRLNSTELAVGRVIEIQPSKVVNVKSVESAATALVERVKKAKEGPCERRLPKGAWCKSCGKIHP